MTMSDKFLFSIQEVLIAFDNFEDDCISGESIASVEDINAFLKKDEETHSEESKNEEKGNE